MSQLKSLLSFVRPELGVCGPLVSTVRSQKFPLRQQFSFSLPLFFPTRPASARATASPRPVLLQQQQTARDYRWCPSAFQARRLLRRPVSVSLLASQQCPRSECVAEERLLFP